MSQKNQTADKKPTLSNTVVLNVLRAWLCETAKFCASFILLLTGFLTGPLVARADTPLGLLESFAGNINITGTGNTLRTAADPASCTVANNGSMQLSGIPAGATVTKAYLYWAGSGGDPQGGVPVDYNVTFNGTAVTADRTYTAWYNAGGANVLYFFGGVKDVTPQVTGNGVYTFADLTVQTANIGGGGRYCASAAVLSAFSLVVVYSDPAEILHVVNIWEGFQTFRDSSITLTPTNFIVPTPAPVTPLSSRILVMTWEGDSGNSGTIAPNFLTENLTFCSPAPCGAGTALTTFPDNPLNNQFNSTVEIPPNGPDTGTDTTWGLDLDMYDITALVPAGAASAQSVYSSGGDLVILSNQTMALPNVPVADLAVTKGHAGDFTVGVNGTYTIGVSNNGPSDATGTITVTDTLPLGLTYVSASGAGWGCVEAPPQTVTCTRSGPLANGATAPAITLNVAVDATAYPGVTNTVSVTSGTFDNVAPNSTNVTDPTTVLAPDLSTSTKTWVDLNGGDADPGDVIRYTIEVIETGGVAASDVTTTDNIPANVTGFTVVSIPPGATDSSTGGYLNITNISLPANGAVTIVFDVTVAAVPPGTQIDNTASVVPLAGTGATPSAPTLIVSQSSLPSVGNKPLYLYGATGYELSRLPTPVVPVPAFITIPKNGASQAWTQTPVLQAKVTLDPSVNPNIPVNLYLASNQNRDITTVVSLSCGAGPVLATQSRIIPLTTTVTLEAFNLPLPASIECATGQSWVLTIQNNTTGGGFRDLRVYPVSGGNISQTILPSLNVINVDSVAVYDAPYSGGSVIATTPTGATVYVRSVISDPFGSFDVTGAAITITDPLGAVTVNAADMGAEVADSGALTKTYEYSYAVPAGGPAGNWTIRVVGTEGTEGTVTNLAQTVLDVYGLPNILMLKSVVVQSDPFNGAVNPKAIPGAAMLYTVTATNQGLGATDADTVMVTDPIPANTELFVGDLGGAGSGPILFTDGAIPSGLSYSFLGLGSGADNLSFSNDGGSTWTYTPAPDPDGYDANVTNIRVAPGGAFNGSVGPNQPSFNLQFRVRVK